MENTWTIVTHSAQFLSFRVIFVGINQTYNITASIIVIVDLEKQCDILFFRLRYLGKRYEILSKLINFVHWLVWQVCLIKIFVDFDLHHHFWQVSFQVWDISRLTKVTHFITTIVYKICFILIGTCIVQIKSNQISFI